MSKYFKLLSVTLSLLFVISCSSYRAKFGGYKENQHLRSSEDKPLVIPTGPNVKAKSTMYSIPKIDTSFNLNNENVDKLAVPPGF